MPNLKRENKLTLRKMISSENVTTTAPRLPYSLRWLSLILL